MLAISLPADCEVEKGEWVSASLGRFRDLDHDEEMLGQVGINNRIVQPYEKALRLPATGRAVWGDYGPVG